MAHLPERELLERSSSRSPGFWVLLLKPVGRGPEKLLLPAWKTLSWPTLAAQAGEMLRHTSSTSVSQEHGLKTQCQRAVVCGLSELQCEACPCC